MAVQLPKRSIRGFTLIEVLVVVGILSVLAVALLAAINPAEAQRKTRDVQRLKDLSTLQVAIDSYLNDHPGVDVSKAVNSSLVKSTDCGAGGWLGIDVCPYINKVPLDPQNRYVTVTTSTATEDKQNAFYYVNIANGGYHICSYLESKSNANKLKEDGIGSGANAELYDVYSSSSISCPGVAPAPAP